MLPEEFNPDSPGMVVRSVMGHWTFEPNELPPALSLDWEMVQRLSEANIALGELAGVGKRLPNPMLLIRPFIRREAVLSSRIEGTVTRLDQLFLFEVEQDSLSHPSDAKEVENYVQAATSGLSALQNGLSFDSLLDLQSPSNLDGRCAWRGEAARTAPRSCCFDRTTGAELRKPLGSFRPATLRWSRY